MFTSNILRTLNKYSFCLKSGKVWTPKNPAPETSEEDGGIATEWDEILKAASEDELVDLAGN